MDAAAQLPFWIAHQHPGLTADNHAVRSPATTNYNCIAWAVGEQDEWFEPGGRAGTTWPDNLPDGDGLEPYIQFFATYGYEPCEHAALEAGFAKLAIYADDSGFTHVSRQLPTGTWTSKLGGRHDIEHAELAALEDDRYGAVAVVLRRRLG